MATSFANATLFRSHDIDALLDLGFSCSTGTRGHAIDLVSAHKWFNLAALAGSDEAQYCRSDIADQMSRQEIAEAQRQARTWLAGQSAH